MDHAVEFQCVSRDFGTVKAVDKVNLEIKQGEFFAMLGPSGSGKTTCLRLIAGFEQPTAGAITLLGKPAAGIPPYARSINTVFQDYALFPHLNVADNIGYGLMIKKVDKATRAKAVQNALLMVRLEGYGERKPTKLSGGQRQRVALARALINEPKVLLLDEPLGALDQKLREEMQQELKTLQRNLGITFIFVTHDQSEALSMADRVAVFNKGKIIQVGSPQDIYYRPNTEFIADFVGSSNVLSSDFVYKITGNRTPASLRPEVIQIVKQDGYEATVLAVNFLGASTRLSLQIEGAILNALVDHTTVSCSPKDKIRVNWSNEALHFMEPMNES